MTLALTYGATDKQMKFILDLAAGRAWEDVLDGQLWETVFDVMGNVGSEDPKYVDRREASAAIDALLKCPKVTAPVKPSDTPAVADPMRDLPLVKFALPRKDDPNEVAFFEVVERKNGRRFINRLIGAPGTWQRQFLPAAHQASAARAFAADVKAAMDRYSDEFTACSRCDSPLSDDRSRAARLGFVCAGKLGRDW